MPTTLFGVAFYVFALFPGIAFGFAREGHRPVGKRSVVRETATVVFISTICDSVIALMIAIAAAIWPDVNRVLSAVLQGDFSWPRENLLVAVVLVVAAITASTLLGLLLGSKWAHDKGLKAIWASEIARDTTAWSEILHPDQAVRVQVGLTLKSGAWISGTLYDFDPNPDPDPHRTITLNGEITIRTLGSAEATPMVGTDWIIIEAEDIEVLQVSYLLPETAP
jgi:hypothetical protein